MLHLKPGTVSHRQASPCPGLCSTARPFPAPAAPRRAPGLPISGQRQRRQGRASRGEPPHGPPRPATLRLRARRRPAGGQARPGQARPGQGPARPRHRPPRRRLPPVGPGCGPGPGGPRYRLRAAPAPPEGVIPGQRQLRPPPRRDPALTRHGRRPRRALSLLGLVVQRPAPRPRAASHAGGRRRGQAAAAPRMQAARRGDSVAGRAAALVRSRRGL